MNNDQISAFGLNFSTLGLGQISSQITEEFPSRGVAYHLVNAYTLVLANESPSLYRILETDFLICDGRPLAKILHRSNRDLKQIRGADFMRSCLSNTKGTGSHFFLGSTDANLIRIIEIAKEVNENIKIAGYHSPEFTENFEKSLPMWVKMIRDSGASVVWVGLGTPKQDYVAHFLSEALPVHAVAIGAAFDFLSGNVSEAPWVFQKLGLEWFFRLVKEPKRLARRYLIGNFKFIKLMLCLRGRRLK